MAFLSKLFTRITGFRDKEGIQGSGSDLAIARPEDEIPGTHGYSEIVLRKMVMDAVVGFELAEPADLDVPVVVAMVHQGIVNEPGEPSGKDAGEVGDP